MNQLWLSLRLPNLPINLLQRSQPHASLAIVERQRVVFISTQAARMGIHVGMSVSSALALSSSSDDTGTATVKTSLSIVERNPEHENRAMDRLAQWCYQFTPHVSLRSAQPDQRLQANDSLLLEIAGCLSLFHGLTHLLQQIMTGLCNMHFEVISSLAHTPKAAWLLGLYPPLNLLDQTGCLKPAYDINHLTPPSFIDQIQQLPLQMLPITDTFTAKHHQQLHNAGFKTLAQLQAQSRASLTQRYGKALLQQLDKIYGQCQDPQHIVEPDQPFFSERHFLSGLSSVAMLNHPIRDLLEEFRQFLQARQLQCQAFHWRFYHFDKSDSRIFIELSCAQPQTDNFLKLTDLKLNQHRIAAPIETVQLYSHELLSSESRSQPLFKDHGTQTHDNRYELLDTLQTKLGKGRVYQLQTFEDYLPECQQQFVPVLPKSKLNSKPQLNVKPHEKIADTTPTAFQQTLPLWLLSCPTPLRTRKIASEHQHFPSIQQQYTPLATDQKLERIAHHPLEIISDCQRLDSHWWQATQHRDYFIARDSQGLHWIYFDRQYQQWFLHGHLG